MSSCSSSGEAEAQKRLQQCCFGRTLTLLSWAKVHQEHLLTARPFSTQPGPAAMTALCTSSDAHPQLGLSALFIYPSNVGYSGRWASSCASERPKQSKMHSKRNTRIVTPYVTVSNVVCRFSKPLFLAVAAPPLLAGYSLDFASATALY